MKKVIINRDFHDKKQSLGVCYVKDYCDYVLFKSESIERGWVNNEIMVSSIPSGQYELKLEYSPRFKTNLWEIYGVQGRAECKFHAANFARQLNGCIALGKNRADIDGDGYYDVTSSRLTMQAFHKALEGESKAVLIINYI